MVIDKEITCPKCQKKDTDPVPYIYKKLLTKNSNQNLFDIKYVEKITHEMTERQKEKVLKKLTPPPEPATSLPAGAIVLMAIFLSWLGTASIVIGKLGMKTYFIISVFVTLFIAVPFFSMLNLVVKNFKKRIINYRKVKKIWNKQYFCNNCHRIFIPK